METLEVAGRGERLLQEELQTCIADIPRSEKEAMLKTRVLPGTRQVTCLNALGFLLRLQQKPSQLSQTLREKATQH